MAQQTAVSWLIEQIKEDYPQIVWAYKEECEKAKYMEYENMIDAMIYTFNQQNTMPWGMEYLLKRQEMVNDCVNYYNETYTNGL
jgi:hypothetical protein